MRQPRLVNTSESLRQNFVNFFQRSGKISFPTCAHDALKSRARLGNIAYRVGRKLRWDAVKEQVIGDPEANQLAVGTYSEPWKPKGL